ELDFAELPQGEWKEGVEEFKKIAEDELWQMLGLASRKIPGFSEWVDPDARADPWSAEGQQFLNSKSDRLEKLTPRWHQLVGIVKMVDKLLRRQPVLLMDEVGVGKTLQAVGLVAVRSYLRSYYAEHKEFPGRWKNMKYTSTDGNIEDEATIIMCPAALHQQWTEELHRYLKHGWFDVLPFLGTYDKRGSWWQDVYGHSLQIPSRRIILATHSAVTSDSIVTFKGPTGRKHGDVQMRNHTKAHWLDGVIYGRHYGLLIMDECHSLRTLNSTYYAARELRKISCATVGMTATPVMTMVTDLWYIGCFLGVPDFDDPVNDDKLKEVKSTLSAALRGDRSQAKASGTDKEVITRVTHGEKVGKSGKGRFTREVVTVMDDIRGRYDGTVIRRTVLSVDNNQIAISGLAKYHEHIIMLTLTDGEYEELDAIANQIAEESRGAAVVYSNGKSFYLAIRRALLHPACNPEYTWMMPQTLEEWKKEATAKLVALSTILQYHLEVDARVPLQIKDKTTNELEISTKETVELRGPEAKPDKIIVYCAFPSNLPVLCPILELYGIPHLTLVGNMTPAKRTQALKAFQSGGRDDPRVLVMSGVGMVGLNIAFANILIIIDTLWSAQQDSQLIGRIWRQPQPKLVHVYRLIGRNTSDVFLNNISFDKSVMHDAFMGSSQSM
ncbi:P-loop containing nucleoside triphosphate hydrolase protein, partial [Amylocystis lapponica]